MTTATPLNKADLFKNFTIGFIPLLIFIIADELYGTQIGLIVAIAVGIVEFGYYYFKHGRVESFILFDVGLIIALGTVSIILENEIFFKLKPVLIELILAILLAVHAFSNKPLLLMMSKRFFDKISINEVQMQMMRKMTRLLFFVVIIHMSLVTYSAFYMSKEAWAFISGGLFYIIFGVVFVGQWLYVKFKRPVMPSFKSAEGEEWFDIVTEKGEVKGKAPRSAVHGNPQLLHPVVHIHVFNKKGQLYLQKRALTKDVQPGKWDTSVGGHIMSGEDVKTALGREALEELGIKDGDFQPLYSYIMKNDFESELIYTFRMVSNGPFKINHDEIIFGKFWRLSDIKNNLGKNIFTPNFEQEFELLQKYESISRKDAKRKS
jgi:isopentenyldiphosphate isomerase/intracellular septation protein A